MAREAELEFEVSPDEAGLRLDQLLVRRIGGLGRKRAAELCRMGLARVDDRRAAKGHTLQTGQRVRVKYAGERPQPEPELPLSVLLERDDLVVIDKPAGMPSVPLSGDERGTLAGALLARYPEMAGFGYSQREPGVIHRLDTQTSGALLAARSRESFDYLVGRLRAGKLKKRYLALVGSAGELADSGDIDLLLGPDPADRRRVRSGDYPDARPAVTHYRVLERRAACTLVELEAPQAYRHQLRVHLAALGHPILGDELYGGAPHVDLVGRHALHATQIAWAGDATLPGFTVAAPLPPEFARVLEAG